MPWRRCLANHNRQTADLLTFGLIPVPYRFIKKEGQPKTLGYMYKIYVGM